jgi:hypothetical protein
MIVEKRIEFIIVVKIDLRVMLSFNSIHGGRNNHWLLRNFAP